MKRLLICLTTLAAGCSDPVQPVVGETKEIVGFAITPEPVHYFLAGPNAGARPWACRVTPEVFDAHRIGDLYTCNWQPAWGRPLSEID